MFRILLAIYIVAGSLCFAQTITYSNQDSIPGYQKILKSQIIKMEADSAFLYNSRAHEILSRKPNELRNIFALIENERKLHYEMIDSLKKTIDGLTTLGKLFSDSLTNSMKNTDKTLKKMNGNLEDAQKNLEDAQKNLKAAMEKLNAAENEKYWYGIGGVVIGGVVGIVVAVIGKR